MTFRLMFPAQLTRLSLCCLLDLQYTLFISGFIFLIQLFQGTPSLIPRCTVLHLDASQKQSAQQPA